MTHNLVRAGLASALALSALATLSACGGGGGGTPQSTTPVAAPFTKYEVKCFFFFDLYNNEFYTLTSSVNATVLTFTDKSEYFANEDCTGAVVATGVYSGPIATLSYLTTEPNASVKLQTGETVINPVDRGTGTASTATISFSGSGVSNTNIGGKPASHIIYNGGSTDVVLLPVQGATPGGVMLRNGQLYVLTAQPNTGYDAATPLSKSP